MNVHAESIRFTPEAQARAERLADEVDTYRGRPLRVYIEGKGCDGFYYGVSFDEKLPRDRVFPLGKLEVVVDPDSMMFLAGAVVTWVDDERGQGFLVENPQQEKFRGKFYKRKVWRERLEQSKPTGSCSPFPASREP